jgi:hypothetical protein
VVREDQQTHQKPPSTAARRCPGQLDAFPIHWMGCSRTRFQGETKAPQQTRLPFSALLRLGSIYYLVGRSGREGNHATSCFAREKKKETEKEKENDGKSFFLLSPRLL